MPTTEQRIKSAGLKLKLLEVDRNTAKREQEETEATIKKIAALRPLLTDYFMGTKDGDNNYVPVMNDKESGTIKKKLFELIEKL